MPIYEYRCKNGHTFEVMQRISDPPVTECELDGAPVDRVFNPVAVHFKGSGFYNTDYGTRKRSREMAAKGEGKSGEGKSGEGKSDSSSDSKPSSDSASSSDSSTGSSSKKSETAASAG
jgi:putative FmdB family regulatory protein